MKDTAGSNKRAGARDENSSLFSLEALKRKEEEGLKQPKVQEDSGLIDLKALASLERRSPAKGQLEVASMVAPNDLFNTSPNPSVVSAPPAPAVDTRDVPSVAPPAFRNNHTTVIVGGAITAVVVAAAVFMVTRGGAESPGTTNAATASATATATATTAAPPAVTATAAPPEPEPSVAAVTPGHRPAAPPSPASPTPATKAPAAKSPGAAAAPAGAKASKPSAAEPPAKPAEACDLACQMQRAVNKKK